jgi:hypothetical protein
MTPEAWIALGALVVACFSGVLGLLWKNLATRVHDNENRMVTRDVFEERSRRTDSRFDAQDVVLGELRNGIRELVWGRRHSSPPPKGGE